MVEGTLSRLRKRADFLKVGAAKRSSVRHCCIVQTKPWPGPTPPAEQECGETALRIGFTTSRKLGGAVVRNRIRRRLKAAAQEVFSLHAQTAHDYVVIGRKNALRAPYSLIKSDLLEALRQLGALKG